MPEWTEENERRYGRQLEVLAAFYSTHDPGRDVRAAVGLRRSTNDWFIDLRQWLANTPTPTRSGIRVSLVDWPAFVELVTIVSDLLVGRRILQGEKPSLTRRTAQRSNQRALVVGD